MRSVLFNMQFVLICAALFMAVVGEGQTVYQSSQDGEYVGRTMYERELRALNEPAPPSATVFSSPAVVSADLLRYPLSLKARHQLEEARHQIDLGNHSAAIENLQNTMKKYPASVPYARNLLGLEYIWNRDFEKAQESFAEAARLMPHQPAPHSNLGLSLAILGQWELAEQELRKALQLDRANAKAKQILEMVKTWKLRKGGDTKNSIEAAR